MPTRSDTGTTARRTAGSRSADPHAQPHCRQPHQLAASLFRSNWASDWMHRRNCQSTLRQALWRGEKVGPACLPWQSIEDLQFSGPIGQREAQALHFGVSRAQRGLHVCQLTVATVDSTGDAQPLGGQLFEQPPVGFERGQLARVFLPAANHDIAVARFQLNQPRLTPGALAGNHRRT